MNKRFKYPRTQHLPWSLGVTPDDIRCISTDIFKDKNVVVTEKMDGENTTLYSDYIHARSIDSRYHESRDWVKKLHSTIAHEIPHGWRICGENLFARHSVSYESLDSYFYGFSIWNDKNICLSWADTQEWFAILGLVSVPTLYKGPWDENLINNIEIDSDKVEGYVVRLEDEFKYSDFSKSLAKWVRKDHVQSEKHWMHSEIIPNNLKN